MLMGKLGWNKITTQDINWIEDCVFSHIRDPIVKHRKGIAEFFFYNKNLLPLSTDIINNKLWVIALSSATCLDHHSESIYNMLGKNAELINWIPIDTGVDHKSTTFNILESRGVNVPEEIKDWFLTLPRVNESTATETKVFELLSLQPVPPHVLRYLDYDTILYQHVIRNY
jgi:hypothetical protein